MVQELVEGNKSFESVKDADKATSLWGAREEALWSIMDKRRDEYDHLWTTDVAVSISRLAGIIGNSPGIRLNLKDYAV